MREMPLSNSFISRCAVLQYPDLCVVSARKDLPERASDSEVEPVQVGVSEEEVQRRIQEACDAAREEVEKRLAQEREDERRHAELQLAKSLRQFAQERAGYFNRVEGEVVQLALAVARKILQRETSLDPTLLAALVRIALDRMQSGRSVRVHVPPDQVEHWRVLGQTEEDSPRWDAIADDTLKRGDCIVETELGRANFGFEAQLLEIEDSFAGLLAHKPDRT